MNKFNLNDFIVHSNNTFLIEEIYENRFFGCKPQHPENCSIIGGRAYFNITYLDNSARLALPYEIENFKIQLL